MRPQLRKLLHFARLSYLWVTRILLAPNRFKVSMPKRLYFAIRRGYTSDQVGLYGLTRLNVGDYLSEFDWYRSRRINEPFDSMLNNKVVCNEVLQQHISVPRIYFVKNKGRIADLQHPERLQSIEAVLRTLTLGPAMFLKPLGSGRGKGVHSVEWDNGEFRFDRRVISAESLRTKLLRDDGWFLSESIEQHQALAKIYPETSNTVRMITVRDPTTGELEVLFAVLRIGTADTIPVDNGSRGGLVARIDLETGELSEARTLWSRAVHTAHPNSGEAIKGAKIPGWDELVNCVLDVAEKLPYIQFIAWDLLVADERPYVIEANTSSGVNIIQLWGPQRQGHLGDFYRAHGVRV